MGLVYLVEGSAATWAVGDNLLDDENWINQDNWARRVTRIGVAGSDAIAECELELRYGERVVATFRNTTSGAVGVRGYDMQPVGSRLICRPNEEISLYLRNSQSGTNGLAVCMDVKDVARRKSRRRY